ncbi:MAG: DEAD/DEAH box helicase, partial [Brachybacterium sp.]|nr:DEAD/DEAH box helicase [Brachybacterium sp.]
GLHGDRLGPTLLICPMSVVGSWQREAETFAPQLDVHVHHGGDRVRDASFLEGAREVDLVLTTYALLARDLPLLRAVPWRRIVFDEAQHLKNPGTQVTRAARSLPPGRRIALTGTPVENKLQDLHALMEIVNPGLLGPRARFQETIARPIEEPGEDGADAAIARLQQLTGPFVLRRTKTDRSIISDLPEKTELTSRVNLTPEQAGLYEALVAEMLTEIDGANDLQRRAVVGATLTRLKQVCNHPAHYLGDGSGLLRDGEHRSGKLELIDDLLEKAFADGEKVLLFTQFTTFGHMVLPHWRERFGLEIPFLHGGVAKRDRDAMVAQFQTTRDEPGAMLLSLRAGGTGLTLTAANHVVHIDRWWNPAVENQATDRAFRIGQRKDVQVRKLVCAGTIEERIDQVLADKQELANLAVTAGEGWIADLGDAALASLFALDADAAPERSRPPQPPVAGRGEGSR